MKCHKKVTILEAIRFDPSGEHALELPRRVSGCAPLDALTWGAEGCAFKAWIGEGNTGYVTIEPGLWLVYTKGTGVDYLEIFSDEQFHIRYDLIETDGDST